MSKTHIKDILNLISKTSTKRVINVSMLLVSYLLARIVKKPLHWGLPASISIEPTTSCNLRCPECPSGLRSFTRPTGMLDFDLYKKIIDELSDTLVYLLLYFQGEPYLHPQFLQLVKYAAQKNIYTATSTNGHYLNDQKAYETVTSGLDRLIISIDGTTQETYQSYRVGGSLHKVIEGTKEIVKWKKKLGSSKPYTIFQFLVVKPNQHQIQEVHELGKSLGVDAVWLKTAQIYDYSNGSPLIPTIDKYSRYYQDDNGRYRFKNKLFNQCWKMWHSAVITWDGKIVPCCFDKDASHQVGDLEKENFKDSWRSQAYKEFRLALLRSRSEIDICKNCSEGSLVWA